MIRRIYALSIVVLMLSVVMVGSVSAFTSDIDDQFIDDEFEAIPIPDGSYDWSYPDNPIIWTGAGDDNYASNPENWNQGIAPYNGADVVFNGTSVKNCIWDIDASTVKVNSFALVNGYTGTLTQGDVDMGIGEGGFYQESGTLTGNPDHNIYCNGDYIYNSGQTTGNTINLFMKSGLLKYQSGYDNRLLSLTIDGNVTINNYIYTSSFKGISGSITGSGRLTVYYLQNILPSDHGFYVGIELNGRTNQGNRNVIANGYHFDNLVIDVINNLEGSKRYYNIIGSFTGNLTIKGDNEHNSQYLYITLHCDLNLDRLSMGPFTRMDCILQLNGHSLTANGITIGEWAYIVGDGKIINNGDTNIYGSVDGHIVQAGDGTMTMYDGSYLDRLTVLPKASLYLGSDLYLGRLPTHHYNIFSPDGYGYWIDDTFYTVPIWESVSDDEKPYIAIIFLVLVLVISIIGYHYRIVLLQLVSLLCLAYGISRYISHPVVEWYPIYLILTLAGIVMIIYSIIRR